MIAGPQGTAIAEGLGAADAGAPQVRVVSWPDELRRRLSRDRMATASLVFLVLLIAASVAAPLLGLKDALKIVPVDRLAPPGSPGHLLGADEQGRDMLSRLVWGGRTSLITGIAPVALGGAVGGLLGLTAGYYGGWVRAVTMRTLDVFFTFPAVLLAIAIAAVLGPGVRNLILALVVVLIPAVARVAENAAVAVRSREYIEAARASGASNGRIMLQQFLPHAAPPVIAYCFTLIGPVIVVAAGLSFLGLGQEPPYPDWGLMLNRLLPSLYVAPVTSALPGVPILLTALAFDLLGNALRDMLDPRLAE
jgi:peptide/nickel transport system permease protein